jgi:hypothetical protein
MYGARITCVADGRPKGFHASSFAVPDWQVRVQSPWQVLEVRVRQRWRLCPFILLNYLFEVVKLQRLLACLSLTLRLLRITLSPLKHPLAPTLSAVRARKP